MKLKTAAETRPGAAKQHRHLPERLEAGAAVDRAPTPRCRAGSGETELNIIQTVNGRVNTV